MGRGVDTGRQDGPRVPRLVEAAVDKVDSNINQGRRSLHQALLHKLALAGPGALLLGQRWLRGVFGGSGSGGGGPAVGCRWQSSGCSRACFPASCRSDRAAHGCRCSSPASCVKAAVLAGSGALFQGCKGSHWSCTICTSTAIGRSMGKTARQIPSFLLPQTAPWQPASLFFIFFACTEACLAASPCRSDATFPGRAGQSGRRSKPGCSRRRQRTCSAA